MENFQTSFQKQKRKKKAKDKMKKSKKTNDKMRMKANVSHEHNFIMLSCDGVRVQCPVFCI